MEHRDPQDPFEKAQARQSITKTWDPLKPPPIEGVKLTDVKNVVMKSGMLTELFREEWFEDFPVRHVIMASMLPGAVTNWHCHKTQGDIIFPVAGQIRIGLYDSRVDSPTCNVGCTFNFNLHRPRYLVVPTGVWHALRNTNPAEPASYVVINDVVYDYEAPDDWTLAPGAPEIPVSLD